MSAYQNWTVWGFGGACELFLSLLPVFCSEFEVVVKAFVGGLHGC